MKNYTDALINEFTLTETYQPQKVAYSKSQEAQRLYKQSVELDQETLKNFHLGYDWCLKNNGLLDLFKDDGSIDEVTLAEYMKQINDGKFSNGSIAAGIVRGLDRRLHNVGGNAKKAAEEAEAKARAEQQQAERKQQAEEYFAKLTKNAEESAAKVEAMFNSLVQTGGSKSLDDALAAAKAEGVEIKFPGVNVSVTPAETLMHYAIKEPVSIQLRSLTPNRVYYTNLCQQDGTLIPGIQAELAGFVSSIATEAVYQHKNKTAADNAFANLEVWLDRCGVDKDDLRRFTDLYFVDADGKRYIVDNIFAVEGTDPDSLAKVAHSVSNHNTVTDDMRDIDVKFAGVCYGHTEHPFGEHRGYSETTEYKSLNSNVADPKLFGVEGAHETYGNGSSGTAVYDNIEDAIHRASAENFLAKYGMNLWSVSSSDFDSTD